MTTTLSLTTSTKSPLLMTMKTILSTFLLNANYFSSPFLFNPPSSIPRQTSLAMTSLSRLPNLQTLYLQNTKILLQLFVLKLTQALLHPLPINCTSSMTIKLLLLPTLVPFDSCLSQSIQIAPPKDGVIYTYLVPILSVMHLSAPSITLIFAPLFSMNAIFRKPTVTKIQTSRLIVSQSITMPAHGPFNAIIVFVLPKISWFMDSFVMGNVTQLRSFHQFFPSHIQMPMNLILLNTPVNTIQISTTHVKRQLSTTYIVTKKINITSYAMISH